MKANMPVIFSSFEQDLESGHVHVHGHVPQVTKGLYLIRRSVALQGYLAHKKMHPPRTLQ